MRRQSVPTVVRGSPDGLQLIVPETIFFDGIEPGVASAFEAAVDRLGRAGARVKRQRFPLFAELFDLMAKLGPLVTAEAFALHRERLFSEAAERMDPRVVMRCKLGEKTSMADYIAILDARERMIAELARQVPQDAILVSPTLPHVAPPTAPLEKDFDAFLAMNGKTLRNTLIGNFFDWCGISIPCGTGEDGMPVGLLLSGLPHTDDHLLSAALAAEDIVRG